MTNFEQLTQTTSDFEMCWTAFTSAEQQGKDITAAVAARIAADKKQADERRASLEKQRRDPNRPEVVRRLAAQELERMQGLTFAPTAEETAAFDAAVSDAESALQEFRQTGVKLRALFGATEQELKAMRGNTLGNGGRDHELAQKWLDGTQKAFDRLVREGSRNEGAL